MPPLRVLLVEDSTDDALLVVRELRRAFGQVEFERVETSGTFGEALRTQSWDVIISDHRMPRFDSLEALTLLQTAGLDIPFIIVSGTIGEENAVAVMKAGAADYILKDNLLRLAPAVERERREAEVRRDRRLMERELGASEARYRSTLDNMLEAAQIIGFDWRYLYLNDAAARNGHQAKEEMLGHTVMERFPGFEATEMHAVLRRCMEERTVRQAEFEFTYPDGSTAWFEFSIEPVPEGLFILSLDITARKRMEEEIRALNADLERRVQQRTAQLEAAQLELGRRAAERVLGVMESAPDGIGVVNADGVIEMANTQLARMFGYAPGELVGQPVEILVPERHRSAHGLHRASYGAASRVRAMGMGLELTGIRKDGTEVPIEVSLSPLETGPQPRVVASVRDISWRRWAEDELKQRMESLQRSNAELEQFAYVSSHDLQEPLRMVSAYTQLLADRYGDRLDADAKEFIGYAVDGAKRMQQLIADLLEFSRVRTRGESLQPVALGDVVESVCRDLEVSIGEAGAVVARDDLPTVRGDAAQLSRLFQNLIGNAIKFHGEDPPRIHVSAEPGEREWIISVRDNGIGIAPQHRERAFVIFQRLHGRSEYPGTGIGLAIAKRIVERHGGRIWIEPAIPRGSIFRFTLPAEPGT